MEQKYTAPIEKVFALPSSIVNIDCIFSCP